MKISIIHSSQHSLPLLGIKKLCKNLNLTICFGFPITQFRIQKVVFKLCTKQNTGKKSQEGKQLEFA